MKFLGMNSALPKRFGISKYIKTMVTCQQHIPTATYSASYDLAMVWVLLKRNDRPGFAMT